MLTLVTWVWCHLLGLLIVSLLFFPFVIKYLGVLYANNLFLISPPLIFHSFMHLACSNYCIILMAIFYSLIFFWSISWNYTARKCFFFSLIYLFNQ